ncbi:unnamed protein product, partial [marine sediment metagenome]
HFRIYVKYYDKKQEKKLRIFKTKYSEIYDKIMMCISKKEDMFDKLWRYVIDNDPINNLEYCVYCRLVVECAEVEWITCWECYDIVCSNCYDETRTYCEECDTHYCLKCFISGEHSPCI